MSQINDSLMLKNIINGFSDNLKKKKSPKELMVLASIIQKIMLKKSNIEVKAIKKELKSSKKGNPLRSPTGGVTIEGKFYPGGQFIPKKVAEQLSEKEQQEVREGKNIEKNDVEVESPEDNIEQTNLLEVATFGFLKEDDFIIADELLENPIIQDAVIKENNLGINYEDFTLNFDPSEPKGEQSGKWYVYTIDTGNTSPSDVDTLQKHVKSSLKSNFRYTFCNEKEGVISFGVMNKYNNAPIDEFDSYVGKLFEDWSEKQPKGKKKEFKELFPKDKPFDIEEYANSPKVKYDEYGANETFHNVDINLHRKPQGLNMPFLEDEELQQKIFDALDKGDMELTKNLLNEGLFWQVSLPSVRDPTVDYGYDNRGRPKIDRIDLGDLISFDRKTQEELGRSIYAEVLRTKYGKQEDDIVRKVMHFLYSNRKLDLLKKMWNETYPNSESSKETRGTLSDPLLYRFIQEEFLGGGLFFIGKGRREKGFSTVHGNFSLTKKLDKRKEQLAEENRFLNRLLVAFTDQPYEWETYIETVVGEYAGKNYNTSFEKFALNNIDKINTVKKMKDFLKSKSDEVESFAYGGDYMRIKNALKKHQAQLVETKREQDFLKEMGNANFTSLKMSRKGQRIYKKYEENLKNLGDMYAQLEARKNFLENQISEGLETANGFSDFIYGASENYKSTFLEYLKDAEEVEKPEYNLSGQEERFYFEPNVTDMPKPFSNEKGFLSNNAVKQIFDQEKEYFRKRVPHVAKYLDNLELRVGIGEHSDTAMGYVTFNTDESDYGMIMNIDNSYEGSGIRDTMRHEFVHVLQNFQTFADNNVDPEDLKKGGETTEKQRLYALKRASMGTMRRRTEQYIKNNNITKPSTIEELREQAKFHHLDFYAGANALGYDENVAWTVHDAKLSPFDERTFKRIEKQEKQNKKLANKDVIKNLYRKDVEDFVERLAQIENIQRERKGLRESEEFKNLSEEERKLKVLQLRERENQLKRLPFKNLGVSMDHFGSDKEKQENFLKMYNDSKDNNNLDEFFDGVFKDSNLEYKFSKIISNDGVSFLNWKEKEILKEFNLPSDKKLFQVEVKLPKYNFATKEWYQSNTTFYVSEDNFNPRKKKFVKAQEQVKTLKAIMIKSLVDKYVEFLRLKAEAEILRSPTGGVNVRGKFYPGGQFIPKDVAEKLSEAEKEGIQEGRDVGEVDVVNDETMDDEKQDEIDVTTKFVNTFMDTYKNEFLKHLDELEWASDLTEEDIEDFNVVRQLISKHGIEKAIGDKYVFKQFFDFMSNTHQFAYREDQYVDDEDREELSDESIKFKEDFKNLVLNADKNYVNSLGSPMRHFLCSVAHALGSSSNRPPPPLIFSEPLKLSKDENIYHGTTSVAMKKILKSGYLGSRKGYAQKYSYQQTADNVLGEINWRIDRMIAMFGYSTYNKINSIDEFEEWVEEGNNKEFFKDEIKQFLKLRDQIEFKWDSYAWTTTSKKSAQFYGSGIMSERHTKFGYLSKFNEAELEQSYIDVKPRPSLEKFNGLFNTTVIIGGDATNETDFLVDNDIYGKGSNYTSEQSNQQYFSKSVDKKHIKGFMIRNHFKSKKPNFSSYSDAQKRIKYFDNEFKDTTNFISIEVAEKILDLTENMQFPPINDGKPQSEKVRDGWLFDCGLLISQVMRSSKLGGSMEKAFEDIDTFNEIYKNEEDFKKDIKVVSRQFLDSSLYSKWFGDE